MPIVLHGDAAFPGQGVVAETLNLQALDGYSVGGTVHLIQNNQVGFTTDPDDARSTRWASDLAKGFDVPIIHVNADDVAACISAVRLAFAFRQEFGHDVVIDLIGYRRFGHNEADEPAYTQPEMYAKIKQHTRVATSAPTLLVEQGVDHPGRRRAADGRRSGTTCRALHADLKAKIKAAEDAGTVEQPTGEYQLDRSPSPGRRRPRSPPSRCATLNEAAAARPGGLHGPPQARRASSSARREALGEDGGIDWGHAEALAFASLLTEGTPIRLTGQDAERGTFTQRHMVLHDAKTGQTYCPIQHLARRTGAASSCTTRR